eukprot:62163-Alexandrium_andersonii.AAC.1
MREPQSAPRQRPERSPSRAWNRRRLETPNCRPEPWGTRTGGECAASRPCEDLSAPSSWASAPDAISAAGSFSAAA